MLHPEIIGYHKPQKKKKKKKKDLKITLKEYAKWKNITIKIKKIT